ncbi:MAG: TAT-variant-translocated molybdopterin oxidoreductase [Chitinophagales bacterium]
MGNKQYWQSLEELEQTSEFKEKISKEFEDELPVIDYAEDLTKVQSTGRRDFLKMLGFSVSAAAVATSCKIPVKKAIPYVFENDNPMNLIPGIAEYFASTYVDESGVQNVLVKTREGRPIKIETNPNGLITNNGSSARAQASVLGLYDHTRSTGNDLDWPTLDEDISIKLREIDNKGGKIVVLSNTVLSAVMQSAINEFTTKFTSAEHVTYDPISLSAVRKANEVSLGKAIIPSYDFSKADVIVGVSCDFLGSWLSPVEFAIQYGKTRVPSEKNGKHMSRHYQFQSNATITGAAADYKYPVKPSQEKQLLINLYNAVGGQGLGKVAAVEGADVSQAAKDLLQAKGKALVVCGTNDIECQLITNAINIVLGSYGNTIDTSSPANLKTGDDKAFLDLVKNLGSVDGLILLDCNPAYNTPFAAEFEAAMKEMDITVSLAERVTETGKFATYTCPGRHYLESWDILEPKAGKFCFVQPTINPIFANTRPYVESLLTWCGVKSPKEYDLVKKYALNNLVSGEQGWIKSVKLGGVEKSGETTALSTDLSATISSVSTSLPSTSGIEVVLYESVGVGDGTHAGNPFVQEFPDPIARLTWDNYLAISYEMAEQQGLAGKKRIWTNNNNKTVPTATITVAGKSITLPVLIQFGLPANTVAIALGYGRTGAGRASEGVGQDVYPLVNVANNSFKYSLDGAEVSFNMGADYPLGLIQVYGTLMEEYALPGKDAKYRSAIVKETNLKSFKKDSKAGNHDREGVLHHLQSPYGQVQEFQGHHWGMGVDLNSCIGCGACVVACNVENNVPVVGKTEVFRGHDMHWMRIDRYYSGDRDNPQVSFQPMMCQHCDNAPCENVCPVNATNHSSEGLNQMAYNRCIGTRYCANNCPYKVRRFNWLDYQAADMFGKFNDNRRGWESDALPGGQTDYMFEDLTRMVLNPDVTVRSRGVIEKCSFCVQRIQAGKLEAKKENRPLKDGDIKVACQTSCPTNAISFGDLNDKESQVHQLFYDATGEHRIERNYHVLEEQHFLPSVGYQVKVRNIEEDVRTDFA